MRLAYCSGFSLYFPEDVVEPNDVEELRIVVRPTRSWRPAATIGRFFIARRDAEKALQVPEKSGILGPFHWGTSQTHFLYRRSNFGGRGYRTINELTKVQKKLKRLWATSNCIGYQLFKLIQRP